MLEDTCLCLFFVDTSSYLVCFCVQFSCSVMSNSLQPRELQHARPPCPSPTPRVYSYSCSLSWWCHSTISSPVNPFSSRLHFPSIRVFSNESVLCIRCPKYWSFSFSISPSSEYSGLISFRIHWFDLLAVQGTSPVPQFNSIQPSLWSNSHIRTWLLEKPQLWLDRLFSAKWCLCFLIHCLGLS